MISSKLWLAPPTVKSYWSKTHSSQYIKINEYTLVLKITCSKLKEFQSTATSIYIVLCMYMYRYIVCNKNFFLHIPALHNLTLIIAHLLTDSDRMVPCSNFTFTADRQTILLHHVWIKHNRLNACT